MSKQIDQRQFNKLLEQLAIQTIKFNPDANYSASSTGDDMALAVDMAIDHYGVDRSHLQDMLLFRQKFERAISKRYGVKFTYTSDEDLAVKYQKRRVPKLTQVKSGILDLMIAQVNTTVIQIKSA